MLGFLLLVPAFVRFFAFIQSLLHSAEVQGSTRIELDKGSRITAVTDTTSNTAKTRVLVMTTYVILIQNGAMSTNKARKG